MAQIQHAQPTPSPVAGNGLFADRAISAGEAIVSLRRPLVAVLDYPRLSDTCSNCFLQTHDNDWFMVESIVISACAGCKAVRYCSKVCFENFVSLGSFREETTAVYSYAYTQQND